MNQRVLFQRTKGSRWEVWPAKSTPAPPTVTDAPFVLCSHEHGPCAQWPAPSGVHFYAIAFDDKVWTADLGFLPLLKNHIPVDRVEEDGDEVFIPIKDVRCWAKVTCSGAKLVKMKHDNNNTLHWRCPKCGGYYGEAQPVQDHLGGDQ